MNRYHRILLLVLTVMFVTTTSVAVTAQYPPPPPPPRGYPPPPPDYAPPPRAYAPPGVVNAAPPPLSPVMRVIYAPFYVAGLVLHDGFYYLVIAPFEVFGRAWAYGIEGGVNRDRARP